MLEKDHKIQLTSRHRNRALHALTPYSASFQTHQRLPLRARFSSPPNQAKNNRKW